LGHRSTEISAAPDSSASLLKTNFHVCMRDMPSSPLFPQSTMLLIRPSLACSPRPRLHLEPAAALSGLPPVFLCPALTRPPRRWMSVRYDHQRSVLSARQQLTIPRRKPAGRSVHTAIGGASQPSLPSNTTTTTAQPRALPIQCPGCGAFSQTVSASQPGFFNIQKNATRRYMGLLEDNVLVTRPEDEIVKQTLRSVDQEVLAQQGICLDGLLSPSSEPRPNSRSFFVL